MCAVVQNITKCLLFIIILIFRTYFAIDLFYFHNLKTKKTMEQQPHRVCERTKLKQKHVTLKLTARSIVRLSPQTMQWYQ